MFTWYAGALVATALLSPGPARMSFRPYTLQPCVPFTINDIDLESMPLQIVVANNYLVWTGFMPALKVDGRVRAEDFGAAGN